jgi:hypothetical protein
VPDLTKGVTIEDQLAMLHAHNAVPASEFMLIVEWLTVMPLDGVLALRAKDLHEHAAVYPKYSILEPGFARTVAGPTDLLRRTVAYMESLPPERSPQSRTPDYLFTDEAGRKLWPHTFLPILLERIGEGVMSAEQSMLQADSGTSHA